jgi:hypothetical protein
MRGVRAVLSGDCLQFQLLDILLSTFCIPLL